MPTTTVHFPTKVLEQVDALARRRGVSRSRFVVEACEHALASDCGEWPEEFFALKLSDEDLALLNDASAEVEQAIVRARVNRGSPLL